ncbi:MAG: hypothetical protein U0939_10395 [Pirellulales bacterium]
MDERPLIPSAPTASRVDRFRDPAGMNAFRELDAPVVASLADGVASGTGETAVDQAAVDQAAAAQAAGSRAAKEVYQSPQGVGIRAGQRGDFEASRTSRATLTTVAAALVLASMPLGWGGFALGFSGFMDAFWLAFIGLWFFAGLTASLCMWLLARADDQALRCGVIAEEERAVVVRAVWLCRVAMAASGVSFAAVLASFLL